MIKMLNKKLEKRFDKLCDKVWENERNLASTAKRLNWRVEDLITLTKKIDAICSYLDITITTVDKVPSYMKAEKIKIDSYKSIYWGPM